MTKSIDGGTFCVPIFRKRSLDKQKFIRSSWLPPRPTGRRLTFLCRTFGAYRLALIIPTQCQRLQRSWEAAWDGKWGMAIATSLVIQPREGFVQVGEESSCSLDTLIMRETGLSKQP